MNDPSPAAISPLRQRLIDDMNMRRFSRETQRNYIRDVGRWVDEPVTKARAIIHPSSLRMRRMGPVTCRTHSLGADSAAFVALTGYRIMTW
jgi:hypothetical protein